MDWHGNLSSWQAQSLAFRPCLKLYNGIREIVTVMTSLRAAKSHFDCNDCILLSSTETYMQAIAGKNNLKIGSQTFKLRDIAPEVTFSDYHGSIINWESLAIKVP